MVQQTKQPILELPVMRETLKITVIHRYKTIQRSITYNVFIDQHLSYIACEQVWSSGR